MPQPTRVNQTQMHFTDDLSLENFKISDLSEPIVDDNIATKEFVNEKISGLNIKNSVRFASTANVDISDPSSVMDGVSLAFGDRVLLKNQTDKIENGIYLYNGSGIALTRTQDFDNPYVHSGDLIYVEEGTNNGTSYWILTTVDSFDLSPGLNSYWKLDETSGDRLDSMTFFNLEENGGTISSETGIIDNSVNMDDSDKYLSVSECPELVDTYSSFSVAAWVYLDTAEDMVFLRGQHTEESTVYDSYLLGYDNSQSKFYFKVYEDNFTSSQIVFGEDVDFVEDTWYLLTGTFDINTRKLGICVNNGTINSDTLVGKTSPIINLPVFKLESNENAVHRIDEVGFWRKVLTLGNIHRLYKNGEGRTYPLPSEPIYIGESELEFESYILPINVLNLGNLVTREAPSGDQNGTNTVFTITNTPIADSEMIFLNGILQNLTFDYTISGTTITFVNPPISNDKILVNYLK